MTSTEPTKPKRRGPERGWSQKLWDAYEAVGESDAEYVKSCNRFLDAMVRCRLHETIELILQLAIHSVLKGTVPDPALLPEVSEVGNELDIYRRWWAKHVRWDKARECLCERKPVELNRLHGLLSPKFGERQQTWRMHPMFLSACVQVARRSVEEKWLDDPIPAGEPQWAAISRKMEVYLQSGDWRIDDAPLEDLTDLGEAFNVIRQPKESREDYIIRAKDLLDDCLIRAMYHANEIALHPKVKLRAGPPLDTRLRHEDMLVLRLFGWGNPAQPIERHEIVEAMPDAFLKEDGKPVQHPKAAVSERTDRIGKYLGFLAAGRKTPQPENLPFSESSPQVVVE